LRGPVRALSVSTVISPKPQTTLMFGLLLAAFSFSASNSEIAFYLSV